MPTAEDRLTKLLKMLERQPADAFLHYAIALEHKKAGQFAEALDFLARALQKDAGYCVAYHQRGLIYERLGDVPAARQAYREGAELAAGKGDHHAASEMRAALDLLE